MTARRMLIVLLALIMLLVAGCDGGSAQCSGDQPHIAAFTPDMKGEVKQVYVSVANGENQTEGPVVAFIINGDSATLPQYTFRPELQVGEQISTGSSRGKAILDGLEAYFKAEDLDIDVGQLVFLGTLRPLIAMDPNNPSAQPGLFAGIDTFGLDPALLKTSWIYVVVSGDGCYDIQGTRMR